MVTAKTTKKPTAKISAKVVAKKPLAKVTAKVETRKPVAKKPVAKPVAKSAAVTKPVVKQAISKAAHAATVSPQAKIAVKPVATVKPVAPVVKPVAASAPVMTKSPAPVAKAAVPVVKKPSFKIGELVVYPAHGVGRISNIEEQEIAGIKLELYIVDFEKEKLRLKVPTNRAEQKGMRHLADRSMIEQAMKVIRGRARIKRTMWSRRAQEYDAKINSGDMIAVSEVIRDLYRSDRQPEQSYSERQLFEQALARFARELAAVRKVDEGQCVKELEDFLARNAKRGAAVGEKTEEDTAEEAA